MGPRKSCFAFYFLGEVSGCRSDPAQSMTSGTQDKALSVVTGVSFSSGCLDLYVILQSYCKRETSDCAQKAVSLRLDMQPPIHSTTTPGSVEQSAQIVAYQHIIDTGSVLCSTGTLASQKKPTAAELILGLRNGPESFAMGGAG